MPPEAGFKFNGTLGASLDAANKYKVSYVLVSSQDAVKAVVSIVMFVVLISGISSAAPPAERVMCSGAAGARGSLDPRRPFSGRSMGG